MDSIKTQDHPQSRRALSGVVKTLLAEEEDDGLHLSLCQLPAQGEMARAWGESSPDLWVRAVQQLPPEPLKFVLNSSHNTLPTHPIFTCGERRLLTSPPYAESQVKLSPTSSTTVPWLRSFGDIAIGMMQSSRSSVTSSRLTCLLSSPPLLTPPQRSTDSRSTPPPLMFDRTSRGGVTSVGSYVC